MYQRTLWKIKLTPKEGEFSKTNTHNILLLRQKLKVEVILFATNS